MKKRSCGGKFLAKWQGEGPLGRGCSPLWYQKGHRDEDMIDRYTIASDGMVLLNQ